jgi:hypothetical protein
MPTGAAHHGAILATRAECGAAMVDGPGMMKFATTRGGGPNKLRPSDYLIAAGR